MEFMNNTPVVFLREGWCICGCGQSCEIHKLDLHMNKTFIGFCNNGIRISKNRLYQCICGIEFSNDDDSSKHIEETDFRCIETALKIDCRECKICGLDFNGPAQLQRHEKTKGHINKVEQPLYCKTCNIKCRGQQEMLTHLQTKKHLARLEAPAIDLECKICNIKCLSQAQINAHLKTKKHIKNESKA